MLFDGFVEGQVRRFPLRNFESSWDITIETN